MAEHQDDLHQIPLSDPVLAPPDTLTEPLVDPQLELLPTNLLRWEDFERLLLRIACDIKGLRALRFFGTRGQAQKGLDVVGVNARAEAEGIQSKKWQTFTEADLDAVVSKYTDASLPFTINKLAIGVASQAHERKVTERLMELNIALRPLEIDIWDQTTISAMLREHPQIVMEFFGGATASRFCVPHTFSSVEVADTNAVATADAILRGPLAAAGVQEKLVQADALVTTDPEQALALYEEIQLALNAAGFPAHAAQFDQQAVPLRWRTGKHDEAIRRIMDRLWGAERSDDYIEATSAVEALRALAREVPQGESASQPTEALSASLKAAEFVAVHLTQPFPTVLDIPSDALPHLSPEDRSRTTLFGAERALTDGDQAWIEQKMDLILNAANQIASTEEEVSIRLRLAVADVTGTWSDLLHSARTGTIARELAALVLARHARYLVTQGVFADAEAAWSEAIEKACLSLHHEDAADWLYSQRFVVTRQHYAPDKWHPLAHSLSKLGSKPRITTSAKRSREGALAALQQDELRRAAIYLRRYLCDAVRSGSLNDERDARRLLGDVYAASGEHRLAAHQLIQAASYEAAGALAEALGDSFFDVSGYMASPVFWVAATAFDFAAAQADVIPDEQVDAVVGSALDAIRRVEAGTQVDSSFLSPCLRLSAFGLIAALADRLSSTDAQAVLGLLEDSVTIPAGTHRRTDESHIAIATGIAGHHIDIRDEALAQLVGLYERAPYHFDSSAGDVLIANLDTIGTQLRRMAGDGHLQAAALMAEADPGDVSPEAAEAAATRLRQPTSNTRGRYGIGTNAIADSLLARERPASDRAECIRMLLTNAESPYEGADNRTSYLLAAVNLSHELEDSHYEEFFPAALRFIAENPTSDLDALHAEMRNPLSFMRRSGTLDSRHAAAYLAAVFARTEEDKRTVRDAVLNLFGVVAENEEYYLTRALQVLRSELAEIAPLLVHFGYAPRSLAAITWAESTDMPAELGEKLSKDPNVRVRRALAQAILKSDAEHTNMVRAALESDPRWSVRSILLSDN